MDDVASAAAGLGIEHTVLVQVLADAVETAEILALASGTKMVAGVVGWADLAAAGVGDTIAALRQDPGGERLVGIRHLVQGEADPAWLNRADVRRGLRAVGDAGLCYYLLTLQINYRRPSIPRGLNPRSPSFWTTCPNHRSLPVNWSLGRPGCVIWRPRPTSTAQELIADLSPAERDDVLGNTAVRAYRIQLHRPAPDHETGAAAVHGRAAP